MKTRKSFFILLLMLTLFIAGCKPEGQAEENAKTALPSNIETAAPEDAYPAGESYPAEDFYSPVHDEAYPIKEADLAWLLQTWQLATLTENGVDQSPPSRKLTFNADGSYSMITESQQETGSWTTILLAVDSTLILNRDNGEVHYYHIIDIEQNVLNLRILRDGLQIYEGYLPAD